MTRAATLAVVIVLELFLCFSLASQIEQGNLSQHQSLNCSVLHLLNVQPFPDEGVFAGFDSGLELIPAARLAAEEINNRSDILTGFELKVIDIDAEACGRSIITKGLINLYRELIVSPKPTCIVGVIGFVCSSVTNVLAPIIGHQNIGYVTLANSVSPQHRNIEAFPNLYHTISSSSVHNIVLLSMMQTFNWKRIGLVYDSLNIFYRSTANDFIQRVQSLPDVHLNATVPLASLNSRNFIDAFNIINAQEVRISYWLGNDGQSALSLCEAYHRNFLWPGYVYILRHRPSIITVLLEKETPCSREEMLRAMEGVFLMDYRLYVESDTELVSGQNYSEYRQRYDSELKEFAGEINSSLNGLVYANSFYDQVWTFALALNQSLPFLTSQNLSLSDYNIPNTKLISSVIKDELEKLSFQGASGKINFDESQESPSYVNIFQVQNGISKLVGVYDPFKQNISFTDDLPQDIPGDTFDTVYMLLPHWLGGCILIAQGVLFCLITTNFVLIIWWRKEKEIKATSPLVSTLMVIGCYLLCVGPVLLTVYRMVEINNATLFKALCNLKNWVSVGIELIFATLFFRLLRIYYIFRSKQMTMMSDYWVDKYLVIYALVLCSGKVLLLLVWSTTDPILRKTNILGVNGANPSPHYVAVVQCTSSESRVWLFIVLLYSGILLMMVMFLAVMTRHVKKDIYKDTKKVNVFIFLVTIILMITVPLWIIFLELDKETGANVSEWLVYLAVSMLCQLCLFIPKTLPLAMKKIKSKTIKDHTLYMSGDTF